MYCGGISSARLRPLLSDLASCAMQHHYRKRNTELASTEGVFVRYVF